VAKLTTGSNLTWEKAIERDTMDTALAFQRGCGIELHDAKAMRRINDYLSKRPTFRYLRASDNWSSYYLPMLKRWRQSYPATIPNTLAPHIAGVLRRLNVLTTTTTNEAHKTR
jgi:hypothetical protein